MDWNDLPGRDLEAAELRALVERLAAGPELWRGLTVAGAGTRHFECVYRDQHLDVWMIAWDRQSDTGWHDHDTSSGAVRVVRGRLQESTPRMGGDPVVAEVGAGSTIIFGPDHIHRLTGVEPGTVSVHAYSPALWRMGQYTISDSGVLRRQSVSYAEELRPLAASA
ncbi:MAG: cysteine dioxygenase family protein [Candidatus Dormibacteraeota bacterium]|nr:cysteine dioxygenase family protein [Candidatus Dormibacteraeota bacterium]